MNFTQHSNAPINMVIPNHIEKELRAEAKCRVDGFSDFDMCYNHETEKYDLFAVEVDGIFGTHWHTFVTDEERTKWCDAKAIEWKAEEGYVYQNLKKAWLYNRAAKMHYKQSIAPTLGNLIPTETLNLLKSIK